MKAATTKTYRRTRIILMSLLLFVLSAGLLYTGVQSKARYTPSVLSASSANTAGQNPYQAQKYRKLAEAKRQEAERVPERRDCYLEWARYYDCLADREDAGDNRKCPRPADC
jgi:hypothetical protein